MARLGPVSLTDCGSGRRPERWPLSTCVLAITGASLALWTMILGLALRVSL